MAFLYENIQPGLFNFLIPCLDQSVKMLEGDRIKLLYPLDGSGYPHVLKLIGEIPDDAECYDNYCCPTDCRDMRGGISLGDLNTDGLDVESIIQATINNMQEDIHNQIQAQIQSDIDAMVASTANLDVSDLYATIIPQTNGDKHYDDGYDFFNDMSYMENSNQEYDDYYSFFYLETNLNDSRYIRTVTTDDGDKHIRPAIGADNYVWNSQNRKVVNYSKIELPHPVRDVIELKFDNKDIVEYGFELTEDKQTLLIFGDPEGFFLNKRVKVRYLS